jgi:hypothetical protein
MKMFATYCAWSPGFLEIAECDLEKNGIEPGDNTTAGYDLHAALLELEIGESLSFEQPFNGPQTFVRIHDVPHPDERHILMSVKVNLKDMDITEEQLKECAFDICVGGCDVNHKLYGENLGGDYVLTRNAPDICRYKAWLESQNESD